MNLLKEIFEPVIPATLGIILMWFLIYTFPALIASNLLVGKFPTKYDEKLKANKLDVVVSFIFSTAFWAVLYFVFK